MGTPWLHGRDPLTSLVTLRKIDHPSYNHKAISIIGNYRNLKNI